VEAKGLIRKEGKIIVEIIERGNVEGTGSIDREGDFGNIIILYRKVAFKGSGDFVGTVGAISIHAVSGGTNVIAAHAGR